MKTIIFDFGGVFSIDDDIQEFWQNNAKYFGVDCQEANNITLPIWLKARIGKIDSNLFFSEAAKFVGQDTEEYKKYFVNYTGFREELYDFVIQELQGKYKLGLLSNQIKVWLEPILEEKGFREIFDVIITSYEIGVAKPDIKIYEKVVKELAVDPKDCIYIDDRENNLKPAQKLGMKTILFKDTTSLKEELAKLV